MIAFLLVVTGIQAEHTSREIAERGERLEEIVEGSELVVVCNQQHLGPAARALEKREKTGGEENLTNWVCN